MSDFERVTEFERQLRETLQRREPPRDLTGSVMARIGRDSQVTTPARRGAWGGWRWVSVAAAVAAMLIASVGVRHLEEVRKGEQAKRQLMLALNVTRQKLVIAEKKIDELNHRRIAYE